jgi:hypothetical protein
MKHEAEYKGYRIVCRSAGRLFAQIFPPDSRMALRNVPVATTLEGLEHLLFLAHRVVDEHASAKHRSERLLQCD